MPIAISTTADVAELNLLVNSAYRGEGSKKCWTTEAHLLEGNRIDENTIAGYYQDPNIYILKYTDDTNYIRGCVYLENKGDKLYLGMLSVLPELQASGIGRMLLYEAEAIALKLEITVIEITVISTRAELISWYQRRGYVATGQVLPFHVEEKFGIAREPIKLVVMEKKLRE